MFLCLLTIFIVSSDASISPASDIWLSGFSQARCTWDVKATRPASQATNRVYQRMRALARVTTATSTPVAVFCHDGGFSRMCLSCGVLDPSTGLELLSPHVVTLWVSSKDGYRATLDYWSTGRVYALQGTTRPWGAGVCLTRAATCDPDVVEIRIVNQWLFVVRPLFVTDDAALIK